MARHRQFQSIINSLCIVLAPSDFFSGKTFWPLEPMKRPTNNLPVKVVKQWWHIVYEWLSVNKQQCSIDVTVGDESVFHLFNMHSFGCNVAEQLHHRNLTWKHNKSPRSTALTENEGSESWNDLRSFACEGFLRNSADPVPRFFSVLQWMWWLWEICALIPHQHSVIGKKLRNNNVVLGGDDQLRGGPSFACWPYLCASSSQVIKEIPRTLSEPLNQHTYTEVSACFSL